MTRRTRRAAGAPRPARRRPSARTTRLVVLGLAAVALFSVLVPVQTVGSGTPVALAMLLGAALCGAPLIALARPILAIVAACVAVFALPLTVAADRDPVWPWPWTVPALIAFALFVLVLTALRGWRFGIVPWALGNLAVLAVPSILPGPVGVGAATANLIVAASVSATALLVGILIAGRIRVGEELERSREATAAEQSRRILVEERTRIARELHDVVAHSLSVIQVQAATARYRLADLPEDATAEFEDLAATARTSLSEMRRLLGVLRTDDAAPELAPQQRLADLPALIDGVRRAGVDARLTTGGPLADVPDGLQITAYRLVQEALSNAVRHAPGSTVDAAVRADTDAVHVRVHNTAGAPATGQGGAGHGLQGMRERVALVGGRLRVGPEPDGGWLVEAVLPLTPDRSPDEQDRT